MYVLALISIAFKVFSHLGNIPLSTSTSQSMINESKTVSEQNLSNHKGWPTFSIKIQEIQDKIQETLFKVGIQF